MLVRIPLGGSRRGQTPRSGVLPSPMASEPYAYNRSLKQVSHTPTASAFFLSPPVGCLDEGGLGDADVGGSRRK